jgi:hypothetical protein
MLRLIGRIILVPLGILLAGIIILAFLGFVAVIQPGLAETISSTVFTIFERVWYAVADGETGIRSFGQSLTTFSRFPVVVLFLPVTIVAAVSEVFGLRNWFVQALMAALLTAILPWAMHPEVIAGKGIASPVTGLLAAAGAVGGTIYWMVAGHSAGPSPKTIEERATIRAPIRRP